MLQAFKPNNSTLLPFNVVNYVGKSDRHSLQVWLTGKEKAISLYFSSHEDREQQFANFEIWLTTPTNSI